MAFFITILFKWAIINNQNMNITDSERKFISELLSDKKKFDSYVYTPLQTVLNELKQRDNDEKINSYLSTVPKIEIPNLDSKRKFMALFRNLVTPNYEMHRFMTCADVLSELQPVVFEFTDDKYADINELKFALGKLSFYKGLDKNGNPIIENKTIIEMDKANGKMISEAKTKWGESLSDFHRNFLFARFPHMKGNCHDISCWLQGNGKDAQGYYKTFLSHFLRDGVLFETFLFNKNELPFHEKIVLPSIISIERITGKKPLIVALEPTTIEGDRFWTSYPRKMIDLVNEKLDSQLKRDK